MAWEYSDTWQGGNLNFMINNAEEFYYVFKDLGYSDESISAILGNVQTESAINPHQKEMPVSSWTESKGYGLGQWTPATKLITWANNLGLDYTNGNTQCLRIDSGIEWGNSGDPHAPSKIPPLTWNQFKTSVISVATLTEYYMYYWEKPNYTSGELSRIKRIEQAEGWYEYFTGLPPKPPIPPTPTIKRKMPVYMMLRRL